MVAWKAEQKRNRKKRAESRISQSIDDDAATNVTPVDTSMAASPAGPAPSSGPSEQVSEPSMTSEETPSEMIVDETD